MFKSIPVDNIPLQANRKQIKLKTRKLNQSGFFKENTLSSLNYLGGCSNHALIAETANDKKRWLVRLPGSQSDLLVDRSAESHNTAIVNALGIAPQTVEFYKTKELNGFKVEEFIEGISLDFNNFQRYAAVALASLKKVHDCKKAFLTEYNIFDRIILMCETLKVNNVNYLSFDNKKQSISIETIINQVNELRILSTRLFTHSDLVPSHNDISPFNFIVVKSVDGTEEVKIIDWEFSGMNIRMADIAYIASENSYRTRAEVGQLLKLYFQSETINDADIDAVLFYIPLVDLKVSVWALMQVHMRNESQAIDGLKNTWGPERFMKFQQGIQSVDYQDVLLRNRETDAIDTPSFTITGG